MPTNGRKDVALAILAGTEGLYAMSAFLPSLMTIQAFGTDASARAALRRGELIATLFAVLIGLVTSVIAESSLPIIFTLLGIGAAVLVYEWQIANATGTGPIRKQQTEESFA